MATRRPNILFFFPDQHRADWVGCRTDLPLRTPNLDALCASGVRFRNAFTPSPLCAPARACLASGMGFENCRVKDNSENYPLDLPTYYQHLRAGGYRVAGVGKFDLRKDGANPPAEFDWHLDGSRNLEDWGFTEGIDNEGKIDGSASFRGAGRPKGPYLDYLQRQGLAETYVREHETRQKFCGAYVTALPESAYCDNWLAENGLRFLRGFPADQPWHLVINFTGPHNPMDVTQRMHDDWEGVEFPRPHRNQAPAYSPEDHQRNRQHYAAMIENIDRQVGRFVEVVRERGELDNTLLVYCSDHGEMLGDHGRWGKSIWRDAATRVPLIISGPGILCGKSSDALVSLQDLAATFLAYAGVDKLPDMEARSLRDVLEGKAENHRESIRSSLFDWKMVFDGRFKLVSSKNGEELYDLAEDPYEDKDLATASPEIVARLRQELSVG